MRSAAKGESDTLRLPLRQFGGLSEVSESDSALVVRAWETLLGGTRLHRTAKATIGPL
jgi:hypothetical protein